MLRDVGTGNPDPALIPDPSAASPRMAGRPVLYGEPVIDRGLDALGARLDARRTSATPTSASPITSGAVDAVERLLAQALTRDDAVALEDPCFLASIHTVRLGGYRAGPGAGRRGGDDGRRAAGRARRRASAPSSAPRARRTRPARASRARRAAELRAVLAEHPYVLIIEDDHFSMLSQRARTSRSSARSTVASRSCARCRSSSGPTCASRSPRPTRDTADRLAMRLSPGTTWVSHLLQRLALALADRRARDDRDRARPARTMPTQNAAFAARLARARHRRAASPTDSACGSRCRDRRGRVAERLMRRGWLARTGDEFAAR